MIKNVSDETIARYQLAKRFDASKLRFIWGTRSGDREDLAPGMSTALTFVFKSRSPEDYEERIVINVEGGFPVIIDVSAHRDPPILIGIPIREIRAYNKSSVSLLWSGDVTSSKNSSSDASTTPGDDLQQILSPWRGSPTSLSNEMELDCKNSLVGDEKLVETQLTNFGSSGRFFLISEANWHCRDITDLTDTCKLLTPSFSLWPAYFHLENNQSLILKTLFTPGHPGLHVEKIFIVCDNISVESFELLGDGVMFHWDFLHFSENLRRQSLPELEDNRFSNFFTAQLHPESLSVLVAVSNLSEFDLNFRWDVINDICLGVLPESGILPGNSTLTFDVFSRNYDLCSEFVESNLQLVLEDLPPQAIPREYQEFVEASRRKWRFPDAVEICVANVGVRLPSRTHSIISEEISSGNRDEENFYSDSIEN
ncbi:deleted in lung and esophageal cancer protein 1-like isoform X2 [Fopius arisanus]|uniref:Deleted in lung and esophageal cancer protein 1-like isoform X2 n=1 Tax=Fopius arisanus TaxID=64838 RepID=A0A9R1TGM0_9HYME|nr:PREDICTED: deleted in lung and esophageal cancer protein 1-like isoform X2 [Fopius arisanus]